MSRDFERRLAETLAGLDQGKEIDALLGEHPEEADELAPLLEVAAYTRETLDFFEPPSTAGLAAGRRRMLEAAARKRAETRRSRWESALAALGQWVRTPARGLAMAALLLALLVVAGGATVVAAADSLPGDPLYGVKRTTEQVRLALTTDPAARAALHVQFNQERQSEARAVAAMSRRAHLRFEGVLERRMGNTWIVDGIELIVDPAGVEGEPAMGSTVVVDVVSPGDGTLHAEHAAMHDGPHGPMHGASRPTPSATPTSSRGLPTQQPTGTHTPAMPMSAGTPSTGSGGASGQGPGPGMGPGGPGHGPQPTQEPMGPMQMPATASPQPTTVPMGPGGMGQPTASPAPTEGQMGPGMGHGGGHPTATPVPTQEPGPAPTDAPPAQTVPTETPAPEPTHHGPMMPHPTHTPGSGHPGGGGGHHG